MSAGASPLPDDPRGIFLPWSAFALTLTTLTALYLSAGTLPFLIFLGVAALAASVVRFRLPEGPLPLVIGLAILVGAIALTPEPADNGPLTIGPARARDLFGEAAALGMALQFWIHRPRDPSRTLLYLILFGGVTLLAACNTYEERFLRYLAPAFVVFAMLVLRATRPRTRRDRIGAALLGVSLVSALGFGIGSMALVGVYKQQIMDWGNRLASERPQTDFGGIADQPVLGPMFGMQGTARRILRIEGYPGGHLRGASFQTYRDGRWNPPIASRNYSGFTSDDTIAPRDGRRGAEARVQRLVPENPLVYVPLSARQVDFAVDGLVDWDPLSGGPIVVKRVGPDEYSFRDLGDGGQGILARPPLVTERQTLLGVPPQVAQALIPVARRVVAGARTDREKADRIAAYLMDRHPYSLTFQPGRGDPVVNFVSREGAAAHCEFFASAAALLLRCVGVPTRYVTGYFAHEGTGDGVLVVRGRDAHAWVEAWVDGKAWVTVEATPPTGLPDQHGTRIEWWREALETLQDLWQQIREMLANLTPEQMIWIALLPVAIAGLAFFRRRRRAGEDTTATYPSPPEMAALARRFDALLQQRGAPAPAVLPWSEHLRALPDDAFRRAAEAFVALYDAGRFGAATDRDALERALAAAQAAAPSAPIDSDAPPALPSRQ